MNIWWDARGLPWSKARLLYTQLVACGPPYSTKLCKICNAWGAKCNLMHEQEKPKNINPYKLIY
jgi:hypothetical protein